MSIVWVLVTFVAGILLILSEFLLPGGILGVMGVITLIGSVAIGIGAFPDYALFIVISETIAASVAVVLGMVLIARSDLGKGLVLADTLESSNLSGDGSVNEDPALLGKVGQVQKALRPAGMVLIEGQPVDAVSDGTFLDDGTWVRVTEVHGSRIVVEETDAPQDGAADSE